MSPDGITEVTNLIHRVDSGVSVTASRRSPGVDAWIIDLHSPDEDTLRMPDVPADEATIREVVVSLAYRLDQHREEMETRRRALMESLQRRAGLPVSITDEEAL